MSTVVQLVKFSLVGVLNVSVSFIVFYICYHLEIASTLLKVLGSFGEIISWLLSLTGLESIDGGLSNIVGYLAGMVNSFILNKFWTFKTNSNQTDSNTKNQIHRFIVLNIAGLIISTLVILIFVDSLGWQYIPVWAVATVLVMVLNFFGNKFWTFS